MAAEPFTWLVYLSGHPGSGDIRSDRAVVTVGIVESLDPSEPVLLHLVRQGWWWLRRMLSSVRVDPHHVRVRNFPGWRHTVERGEVERSDWLRGEDRSVGVLLLTCGKTIEVCALDPNRPGGVARLNTLLSTQES